MLTRKTYVVGAGGHGKVALDVLIRRGFSLDRICLTDRDANKLGQNVLGFKVVVYPDSSELQDFDFHIAIGLNQTREALYSSWIEKGARALTLVHPDASVSSLSEIGAGAFIAARSVIGPAAHIGCGVIINHGAMVDHDCRVEAFSHIAPGATLGGDVIIGKDVLIGAGANILPGLKVGANATVGAGAVVVRDVPPGLTVVGIPAQEIP